MTLGKKTLLASGAVTAALLVSTAFAQACELPATKDIHVSPDGNSMSLSVGTNYIQELSNGKVGLNSIVRCPTGVSKAATQLLIDASRIACSEKPGQTLNVIVRDKMPTQGQQASFCKAFKSTYPGL